MFLTSPGDSVAGSPFTSNPRVAVEDSNGNVITSDLSYPSLSITPGSGPNGAVLSSTCLYGTPDQGVYTYYGCSITTAGTYTLTAISTPLQLTSDPSTTFTVSPAAASTFTLSNPGTQTAGTAFNETVTAYDAYGNVATGYTGSQAVTFTGPSNGPNGTAPTYPATVNFTAVLARRRSRWSTPRARRSPPPRVWSAAPRGPSPCLRQPPAPSHSRTPAIRRWDCFNDTITAYDAYGNLATGYTGRPGHHLHRPLEQPERHRTDYPATVNFTAGVGTASITLVDAQTTTLTATQVQTMGSVTGTSGSFTVALATTTIFTVTNSANPTAGTPFSITLTAADAYGNPTPSYTGTHTSRGAVRRRALAARAGLSGHQRVLHQWRQHHFAVGDSLRRRHQHPHCNEQFPSLVGRTRSPCSPAGPAKLAFTPVTPGPGTAGSTIPTWRCRSRTRMATL